MSDSRNGSVKRVGGALAIVVPLLAALTYLGVLPWATRAEVKAVDERVTTVEHSVDERVNRIDRRVDDLHKLFFPARP